MVIINFIEKINQNKSSVESTLDVDNIAMKMLDKMPKIDNSMLYQFELIKFQKIYAILSIIGFLMILAVIVTNL